jgi:hypothetical protein
MRARISPTVTDQMSIDTCMNFSLDSHEYYMVKVSLTE